MSSETNTKLSTARALFRIHFNATDEDKASIIQSEQVNEDDPGLLTALCYGGELGEVVVVVGGRRGAVMPCKKWSLARTLFHRRSKESQCCSSSSAHDRLPVLEDGCPPDDEVGWTQPTVSFQTMLITRLGFRVKTF
ncbi:hypothetical protein Btru_012958 [Bulinus truncatus]|nr:hypothetical protein Btru_012958 [Bulinus truncatus]